MQRHETRAAQEWRTAQVEQDVAHPGMVGFLRDLDEFHIVRGIDIALRGDDGDWHGGLFDLMGDIHRFYFPFVRQKRHTQADDCVVMRLVMTSSLPHSAR